MECEAPPVQARGLLHSPPDGTYPQRLVWDTSCPVLFLILVAMQDILGGVVITVQLSSTVRARVPSHTEVLLNDGPTPATGLAGIVRSHFHHAAASLFRFAVAEGDKGSPACIQDTLIQATFGGGSIRQVLALLVLFRGWCRGHVLDLQVLKHQCAILRDELARGFM